MAALVAVATLALMTVLALRAERRFADHATLPMQYGLDLRPTWGAPRRLALAFMPGLALAVFLPLLIFLPDPAGAAIAAVSLIGGQVFYHHLLGRSA